MEYRYYIITALTILVLQLLLWQFARSLKWAFNLGKNAHRLLLVALLLPINGLLALHLTGIYPAFRPIAFVLVILLFAFFARILTACSALLLPKSANVQRRLKAAFPLLFIGFIGLGLYNAYTPHTVYYQITLDKPLEKPLRIGLASDFHLGKLFGSRQLEKLAARFDQENVDLILLPGDIMDDDIQAYEAENMQAALSKLRAPLGVYATLGNHDFFGQQRAIYHAITQAGITVLWDQAVTLENNLTLIGRNDNLYKSRPSAAQLLKNVDTSHPIILLDHRPDDILAHAELPIDIQVSGHAHNGQIFPANFVVKALYRLHHGYEKIGLGHYFVTSGYGFWGVPFRLGSQSEMMIIDVRGQSK